MSSDAVQTAKVIGDVAAVTITAATVAGALPWIAAGFSTVWIILQLLNFFGTEQYKNWKWYKKWKN